MSLLTLVGTKLQIGVVAHSSRCISISMAFSKHYVLSNWGCDRVGL